METETRARSDRVEDERAAFDEGTVHERSHAWHKRVEHVFHSRNTQRGEELFERLIAEAIGTGGRVLDAGCGSGDTARQAVAQGASQVLAVDLSKRFLEMAVERGDGEGRIE